MKAVLLVLFYVFAPLLITYLSQRFRIINKIGAVVVVYIVGLLIGNIGLLPQIEGYADVQDTLTMLTVPIAIPLLLFSVNLRSWSRLAGKTMLSMGFALVAAVVTVFTGFFIFRNQGISELRNVSGMLVGLYTGSTPNLASIQLALGADETHYLLIATYDLVVGAFHLLFVLTVAQRLYLTFLPGYKFADNAATVTAEHQQEEPYWGLLKKSGRLQLLKALGIAVLIFALGGASTLFVPASSQMAVVILIITTLGIGASLVPAINKLDKSFELGMYLILIFCMVISSMADLSKMNFASLIIGGYVALVVFGSMMIQAFFSWIFKVDADTCLITSTAFICSPVMVPVVAGAIRNREVIFSGLTVGIIGYAIGNYLGVMIAWFLSGL